MARAIILVLDSFGLGACADADKFGDIGSDTFGSITKYCQNQKIEFNLPVLNSLGLSVAHNSSSGFSYSSHSSMPANAAFGYAAELSSGKDTPSGHWEMAGVPVLFDWGYFPKQANCFPQDFIEQLCEKTAVAGTLANCHSSGVTVIEQFGEEHVKTGLPICYTSADSVFQVAAHEEHFGLERLYDFCQQARELLYPLNIGRVIARPFTGDSIESFSRTNNRRDFAVEPPEDTVLDKLVGAGGKVISIGKIADIFAHRGISESIKAYGIQGLFDATVDALKKAPEDSLIFTNFVDFDQNFGHRRDPAGYANALMELDALLPQLLGQMADDDLLLLTADHGCDPCWPGSDHTRENVPVLVYSKQIKESVNLGGRGSFADIGQSLAEYFKLTPFKHGKSFITEIM